MKKILIPIDFSRSSNNAVNYAVAFSEYHPVNQIILVVNVYTTEFEQIIPTADFIQYSMDSAAELDGHLKVQFAELKRSILHKLKQHVRVSFILSKIPFLQSIRNLIDQERPDLMVIGSNHGVSGEESYIGDHLIKIAKASTIPVLIVPELTRYQKVKRALVPFNFSNISSVKLISKMSQLKELSRPELLFLNVDNTSDAVIADEDNYRIASEIKQNLQDYPHHFYYSTEKDVLKSVNHFSFANELELIIALPGKHSFLYNLTHRSIIKGLARNNYKPVLILKDPNGDDV
ncbi:universal stress protein [Mucilaginibacter sp. L196]|uniref:universal stress protein n=1 Tax=Mucilaginibacter sp. L196 TaxID=1641870 RepID=UPI00131E76AB|nr:universal stress protein [Mucilaginibacter sp. L196]